MPWQSAHQSFKQIISKLRTNKPETGDRTARPWHGRMIDLHSHLLPGLDDGAVDWDQSLDMARMAATEGIAAMICTPHWVYGLYDNSREKVLRTCSTLQQRLAESDIPLKVHPGCEIRLEPDILDLIASGRLLTLNDTGRYALIELPGEFIPNYVESCFRNLMDQRITPILSHPERNGALHRQLGRLSSWVEMGVLSQITAASLRGRFGPSIRRFTVVLVEHQMAHFMATDAHAPLVRAPLLAEAVLELEKLIGPEAAEQIIVSNPRTVLEGGILHIPAPLPLSDVSKSSSAMRRFFSFHV